jgi:hypothetical protein
MSDSTLLVITALSLLLALASVYFYERSMARLKRERDEAVADCELFSQLLLDHAIARHPSSQQYGGGNLRIVP